MMPILALRDRGEDEVIGHHDHVRSTLRDRCRMADRAGEAHRRLDPLYPRYQPGRGTGPGSSAECARAMAESGHTGQAWRLAHDGGEKPRHRPDPQGEARRGETRGTGT